MAKASGKSTAKKTTTKKKTSSASKKSTSSKSTARDNPVVYTANKSLPAPIRRELGAVFFFALTVLFIIGSFNTEGKAIFYLVITFKGLIGHGYLLCIPACLLCTLILAFHRGRPVELRVYCALLIPIFYGMLMYLLFNVNLDVNSTLVESMFNQGQRMEYGGVITGLLGYSLKYLLGQMGAILLTGALMVAAAFFAVGTTIRSIGKKFYDLTGGEYVTENEAPEFEEVPAQNERAAKPRTVRQTPVLPFKPAAVQRPSTPAAVYDIPLGDEERSLDERENGRRASSKVKARKKSFLDEPVEDFAPVSTKLPFKEPDPVPDPDPDGFRTYGQPGYSMQELPAVENVVPVVPVTAAVPVKPVKKTPIPKPEEEAKPARRAAKPSIDPNEMALEVSKVSESVAAKDSEEETYVYPPVSLLKRSDGAASDGRDEINSNSVRLDNALKSFGIKARIVGAIRGPTVTRYDVELDQGVKLAKVTNLAGDLALALGVVNVRIAPIPDKISTVGIEVPNKIITTVYLGDIIGDNVFKTAKSKITFSLGKDIGGDAIVGNIAKLPHLLIAGTTGSGKSVCMNSLILSLLYKATPDEVRLIMIDPKMVELGIYNSIPHLYVPVVTDPKKAAGALQWSVVEMLKRYQRFADDGVRDLESFNRIQIQKGEKPYPQVVIVIDELADLMMIASKEVEESICRVAQMGRAAGMHLVIATQRPSSDVITGLMKANIPSRIAFAVSSTLESRIILDQGGAEKLIGMGDMLFSPVGTGKPKRIQGAYVSDEERESVIDFIKENCSSNTEKNDEILDYMNKAAEKKDEQPGSGSGSKNSQKNEDFGSGYDEMLPQAVEAVLEAKSCSVSMLQRRVKLGYSRAARIVDQMEELGIVGPYEGAKPRSVVITREGWNELQVSLGMASDSAVDYAANISESYGSDDEGYEG